MVLYVCVCVCVRVLVHVSGMCLVVRVCVFVCGWLGVSEWLLCVCLSKRECSQNIPMTLVKSFRFYLNFWIRTLFYKHHLHKLQTSELAKN